MKKIAAHVHTLGRSGCAKVAPVDVVQAYHAAGYHGIAVTNHYMKWVLENYYPAGDELFKLEFFLDGYREVKSHCERLGMTAFLGMELNLERYNRPGESYPVREFLCYGLSEDFILQNPRLYDLSQREAFELLDAHGIVMCQAHPFRRYAHLGDPLYMHGVEVFNGHPVHNAGNRIARALAEEFGFIQVAGDDYHDPDGEGSVALLVPDDVTTDAELALALRQRRTRIEIYRGR